MVELILLSFNKINYEEDEDFSQRHYTAENLADKLDTLYDKYERLCFLVVYRRMNPFRISLNSHSHTLLVKFKN